LAIYIALSRHLYRSINWALNLVHGSVPGQFRVAVGLGRLAVRQQLDVLVIERIALHLNTGRRGATSPSFRTSGSCGMGLALATKEEETGTGED
jgi:hypothetical protein